MERSDLFKEQHRYPFETLHNLVAEYVLECHCGNNIIEYYDLAKNKKILKINRFDVYKYWKTSNNFNIKFLNNLNLSMPIDCRGFIDFFNRT